MYAENTITKETIIIDNITQFAKSVGMNPTTICHKVNGKISNPYYKEWKFYRK